MFAYVGTEARYYPQLGAEVEPGSPLVVEEDPGDGRWEPQTITTAGAAGPPPAPPVEQPPTDSQPDVTE